MERIGIEELAKQFYEKANEMGIEVLGVRAFHGNWTYVTDFTGSVAHNGRVLMADKIKIKLCHSGKYTLNIIRRKHDEDPHKDIIVFKHQNKSIEGTFEEALLTVRDKMFVNV